jgi:hypothetical protein
MTITGGSVSISNYQSGNISATNLRKVGERMFLCNGGKSSSLTVPSGVYKIDVKNGLITIAGPGWIISADRKTKVLKTSHDKVVENLFVSKSESNLTTYESTDDKFSLSVRKNDVVSNNWRAFPKLKFSNSETFKMPTGKAEKAKEGTDERLICKICMDNLINTHIIDCNHAQFCSECAKEVVKSDNPKCPICRCEIKKGISDIYI